MVDLTVNDTGEVGFDKGDGTGGGESLSVSCGGDRVAAAAGDEEGRVCVREVVREVVREAGDEVSGIEECDNDSE